MSLIFLRVLTIATGLLLMSASLSRFPANTAALAQPAPSQDKARLSGRALEDQIEAGFRARGFDVIADKEWDQSEDRNHPHLRRVILDARYASIYGHAARIEFLLLLPGRRILIEVKRQNTSGSTDEKLPYVYANAELNISFGQEFVLIMDGEGWKPGARDWIAGKDRENDSFTVFTPDEFLVWVEGL